MARRGNKPYWAKSKYERMLEESMDKMKLPKPQETCERGGVQGCGDPSCPICMPSTPGAGGGLVGSPERARFGEEYITIDFANQDWDPSDDVRKAAARAFGIGNFVRSADFDKPESPADRKKGAARRAEEKLRDKVKRFFVRTAHSLTWEDVIGNETARAALIEAIEHPVKFKELYAHYRKKPTKGILLSGPPGCGKTMFGKAAAAVLASLRGKSEGEHTMMHIKGPEIQSPYVGVTEEIIRDVFAYARAYEELRGYPMVIFIDEADAILPSRDGNGSRRALPWEESNVASFLTEMDGIDESGTLVILATNRPHAIDSAILRDGRIDRKIKIERPTQEAVVSILAKNLAGVPLASGHVAQDLARYGAEAFFAHHLRVCKLTTARGTDWLTLGNIVNGAMIVGLVEQAKACAFARDIANGGKPGGLIPSDIEQAIASILIQNTGLNHTLAIEEFCERLGVDSVRIEPIRHTRPTIEIDGETKAMH